MPKILSVPHRHQLADGYCLPACVQMVLAYWGLERDQSELARQMQSLPGVGTPGSRVKRLASSRLGVHYGQGQESDLQAALAQDIPPIALIHTRELPYWSDAAAHAVTLVGMTEQTVILNDPALPDAPVRVSLGDFLLAWDEMANLYALLWKK